MRKKRRKVFYASIIGLIAIPYIVFALFQTIYSRSIRWDLSQSHAASLVFPSAPPKDALYGHIDGPVYANISLPGDRSFCGLVRRIDLIPSSDGKSVCEIDLCFSKMTRDEAVQRALSISDGFKPPPDDTLNVHLFETTKQLLMDWKKDEQHSDDFKHYWNVGNIGYGIEVRSSFNSIWPRYPVLVISFLDCYHDAVLSVKKAP